MAKLYGKNPAVDFAAANLMSFGKSFSRLSGQPLDKSEIWYDDYDALVAYAKTDAAYVGQKVVYVDTTENTVTHYGIELDGTLKELGTSPIGDEKTIVVADDGTISLAGISGLTFTEQSEEGTEVAIKYQPLLTSAGLTWVRPSATTVEGLATEIEALNEDMTAAQGDIAALEGVVGDASNGLVKGVADNASAITAINDKIGTVTEGKTVVEMISDAKTAATYDDTEIKADIQDNADAIALLNNNAETAGSVDYKIAQAVAQIMENPDETMNSINELVTWCNEHAESALALSNQVTANKNNIEALETLVGDTAVATQITDAIAEALKIEGADKYALAADLTAAIARIAAAETKLTGIEEEAEKNIIASVDTDRFTIDADRKLFLKDLPMANVTGLAEALAGKVNAADGERLMTNAEGTKLAGIETGAQVNKIESVDETQFAIDESKKLTLLAIAQAKVTGLADALAGKVDKAEGYRLISPTEATKLEALVLGDGGQVEISGKVNYENVEGLSDAMALKVDKENGKSLVSDTLITKLEGVAEGAQANVIESVKIGGTVMSIVDKIVNVPISDELAVTEGTLGIAKMSVDKLYTPEGVDFVLNGGKA